MPAKHVCVRAGSVGASISCNTDFLPTGGSEESCREADHGPREHPPSGAGSLPFRDDKQETVVVRPYPQVQAHGQPLTVPQHLPIQPGTPVTVSAPPTHITQALPLAFAEGPMKVLAQLPFAIRVIEADLQYSNFSVFANMCKCK